MKKMMKAALATLALGAMMTAAQALPAPWVYGAYGYYNPYTNVDYTVFTPGSFAHVDSNAAFAAIASLGGPLAQAHVDTAGSMFTKQPNVNARSSAAVQYDFYVTNGQTFSDLVPITIRGQVFMTSGGASAASGYARIVHSSTAGGVNNGSFSNKNLSWGCGAGGSDCGLFSFEVHLNVSAFAAAEAGEIARINLFASAQIAKPADYATQASAWVDPVISIDAGYLASHPNAALVMDASIINTSPPLPVPEPGIGALMLSGLAVVGARLRRRQSPH